MRGPSAQWALARIWADGLPTFIAPKSGAALKINKRRGNDWLATQDGLMVRLTSLCDCENPERMVWEDSRGAWGYFHAICRRLCERMA